MHNSTPACVSSRFRARNRNPSGELLYRVPEPLTRMSANTLPEPLTEGSQASHSAVASLPRQSWFSESSAAVKGRVLLLLSAVAFAVMGLTVRWVPAPISSYEKVFYRSLIGTVLLLVYFAASRTHVGRPTNLFGLLCRGVFGAASLLCFFYAIDTVGLAKATLYCYMYPIYASVFAWWDLGEKPSSAAILALLLAVIGAVLTLDSDGMSLTLTRGDAAGIASGIMSGAAVTSIRRLTRTERSTWIVLSFTVAATLMAVPFMGGGHATATVPIISSLVAVGVSAIIAQMLLTKGMKYVTAVEGGVLSLTTVPLSALFAMLLLQETLRIRFWMGAALILAAAISLISMPNRNGVTLPQVEH